MSKGTLIPIGGNEDKGNAEDEIYRLDYIEEGILYHVVKEAGGEDANIIVVPTASSIPKEVGENYLEAFSKLGCKNVKIASIRKRGDSEKEEIIKLFKEADCVMFSGGNQSKISEKIGGTTIHNILSERYANEQDFVIAGTSAGAMMMAQEMIAGGSSTKSFIKGAVKMKKGLQLLPNVIIDTHFIRRGRFGRISEAISKYPNMLGIGLAEDTGMIIRDGYHCTVIGSGMAIIFDGSHLQHNNQNVLEDGTPMTLTNLTVHVLANNDKFDLKTRQVDVLPIEADFI